MKFFTLLSLCALLAAANAQEAIDENCDRILNTMIDGCNQIREQTISQEKMEPKVVCCSNLRYTMAVQSVKAYAAVARATRICSDKLYEKKIADLENNIAMAGVKTICANFQTQTCITEPVSNAWNSAVQSVQSNYNQLNMDAIGQQLGQNWNQAISSLSNFASNLGNTISQQNIPGRLQEGASAITSQLRQGTQQLTDMVSGQGANRYSLVGDQSDSLSLDSIVHSVIPDVEIVEAKPTEAVKAATGGAKRFNLMEWFGSLTQNAGGALPGGADSPAKTNEAEQQRRNPYSI